MKWSWRIARVAGIGIYVHATFLFLLAWIAIAEYHTSGSVRAVVIALGYTLAVFVVVVLHEYGHALTARRYGIQTRDITLLPIGGVARLERMPRVARQEMLIALAGPAVNAVLAALGLVALRILRAPPTIGEGADIGAFTGAAFLAFLVQVNVWLGAFNLIPAFPMDGGRVLRAALSMRGRSYAEATETAARVGRGFALLFGIVGLFVVNNPFLVIIALFVWLAAAAEAAAVQRATSLEDVSIERIMIRDVRTLAPTDRLDHAVELILDGFQQDFPVVRDGEIVGVLTRGDLLRGLSEQGPASSVRDAMHRSFVVVQPDDPVDEVLDRLRACDCQVLPVVRGHELLGVLTLDNVGEYVMVRAAVEGREERGARIEGRDRGRGTGDSGRRLGVAAPWPVEPLTPSPSSSSAR